MTTMADLVESTRRQLASYVQIAIEILNEDLDATETDVTVTSSTSPAPVFVGQYIGIDYELMLVRDVSGTTLTVVRGQLGTTATTHTSGAVIDLAPRFARGIILQTLVDELRSWPRDLYRVETIEVDVPANTATVELPVGLAGETIRIVRAQRRTDYNGYDDTRDVRCRLIRDDPNYGSGYGMQVDSLYSEPVTLIVTYAQEFNLTAAETSTTTTTTIGLANSMLDIPPIGVTARLLQTRDVERTDSQAQGQTRRAEEVQVGAMVTIADRFFKLRDRRISEEVHRLRERWGVGY